MLVRLLVVVLTVVGPMPSRVCTCAASVRPTEPAHKSAPQPSHETKSCGCGHRAKKVRDTSSDTDPVRARAGAVNHHSHPNQHDRDCPAVNSRTAATAAAQAPVPVTPAADVPNLSAPVETLRAGHSRLGFPPTGAPDPFGVPLYLVLCTLRN